MSTRVCVWGSAKVCLSGSASPFIGGALSKPHERWPELFADPFWVKYPYFLPCGAASVFSAFVFLVTAIFLKEVTSFPPVTLRQR